MKSDADDMDERHVKPFFPIPRNLAGPPRPGYVPYRLFLIMEMIRRATWYVIKEICGHS